ncbi:MAG: dihydrodipicolinate reductase C-terminal domain-containing protein [Gemmatimonadaceae bacterium]
MRLAMIGDGRMGREIAALAAERGHEVVALVGAKENEGARWLTREHAALIDVAIEFTEPDAAAANVSACLSAGIPIVTGTTGWYDRLPALEAEAQRVRGSLFWAPNFSLGVALAMELMRRAGQLFAAHPQFGAQLVETHHDRKKDAPSGTALALVQAVERGFARPVPTSSIRVGHVPGTHTLLFDGPFEQVAITHEARDRRVFADGALRAAEWLRGRTGVFTMKDLLRTPEDS